jgi:hypothetical protein
MIPYHKHTLATTFLYFHHDETAIRHLRKSEVETRVVQSELSTTPRGT